MIRGRWLIVGVALVAWFAAFVTWIGNDPRLSATAYDELSSYNTSPGGLSQAFAYLEARDRVVRRLTREIAREQPPHDAVVFRIGDVPVRQPVVEESDDTKPPKKKEEKPRWKHVEKLLDDDDEEWVRGGGRLVLAPSADFGEIHLAAGDCSENRLVFPVDPPLPKIDTPHCHTLSGVGLQRFHSVVINDAGPILARQPLAAGEVIVFSSPEAFSNQYVGRGGNLALLERLSGNGAVYFDETMHGIAQEGSIWELLVEQWRLGPALAILAAAVLAAFWRKSRATGGPERGDRDVRSDAVELVQSLGQLYDRAVDREESLRLYYQALVRAVHARTGLSGDALDRLVRERTRGYDPRPRFQDISREEFQRMLHILNHAYETVGYANTR